MILLIIAYFKKGIKKDDVQTAIDTVHKKAAEAKAKVATNKKIIEGIKNEKSNNSFIDDLDNLRI
jgi:hypothetical protein